MCRNECPLLFFFYSGLLESLCYSLYDTLRPVIIHTNHLETLADLCIIFKVLFLCVYAAHVLMHYCIVGNC